MAWLQHARADLFSQVVRDLFMLLFIAWAHSTFVLSFSGAFPSGAKHSNVIPFCKGALMQQSYRACAPRPAKGKAKEKATRRPTSAELVGEHARLSDRG